MTDLRDQLQSTLAGSYRLERELDGGGMSRVFVPEETKLWRVMNARYRRGLELFRVG